MSFKAKAMKRINNLYDKIFEYENLVAAELKARKGKSNRFEVKEFDKNKKAYLLDLQQSLQNKTYATSAYTVFKVYEPKEREVYKLPYFPDRIAHHAIMNILEPIFLNCFTADAYSCIKGKGIHATGRAIKRALKNVTETKYCLKFDIVKFYPNVNHNILKQLLRRKFKDNNLLWLLDEIIDSAKGLPIGNYLSQYFANFYLTYFDHWIKETKQVKHYFRYADDIVILSSNKEDLHQLLHEIKEYLTTNLRLSIKSNYQIFPVESRGIDFVGYKFFHTHTLLRKSIKKSFAKALAMGKNPLSIASYSGWAKHADCKNLLKTLKVS